MTSSARPSLLHRVHVLVIGVSFLLPLNGGTNGFARQPDDLRPNVVVILADDMGYSDLGCTGGEIRTTNLDKLAQNGVLFTHFYTTSRCCPSRAALLTGQYQWDAGLGHMTSTKSDFPEYQPSINQENVTIAEAFRLGGYQTVMSGKWHLGDMRQCWPDKRGFDQFYGTPAGGGLYFYPSKFYDRPVFENSVEVKPGKNWYSTDGFTDFAIEFIEHRRDPKRPFFLYLPYIAPHFPLQAKPEDIARYHGKYDVGYQAIRQARFDRQKALGIVPRDSNLPAAPHQWNNVSNKSRHADRMEVYAAQVDCLDQNIGRLVDSLEKNKLLDNTIIVFMSDNGGCSARKTTPQAELGSANCNAAYGHWYHVSNTPYRMAKSQEHEGGIISPLIFHWPRSQPGRHATNGQQIDSPVHIMDVMPTLLELAGVSYPDSIPGRTLDPMDGQSFAQLLAGHPPKPDRELFWEHEGNRAMRRGAWKLVALRNRAWELYDLGSDPFEENDLAATEPERVNQMKNRYHHWAKLHGVKSWPLNKAR